MACASINEICIFPTYIEFVLSFEPFKYSFNQCCLLTVNIACHENGIPKFLPVKRRFVEKIALQKVNTSNICTKQYIIPFYPLHLSKFHIHDPIVFLQCVVHSMRLTLNHLNVLYSIDFFSSL